MICPHPIKTKRILSVRAKGQLSSSKIKILPQILTKLKLHSQIMEYPFPVEDKYQYSYQLESNL